jgi:hypothetical protein
MPPNSALLASGTVNGDSPLYDIIAKIHIFARWDLHILGRRCTTDATEFGPIGTVRL